MEEVGCAPLASVLSHSVVCLSPCIVLNTEKSTNADIFQLLRMARAEANDDITNLACTVVAVDHLDTTLSNGQAGPILCRLPVFWPVSHSKSISTISAVGFTNEMAVLESPH